MDQSNADAEAALRLLARVPESWTAFDFDQLTTVEQKMLGQMCLSGMIERRVSFQLSFAGRSDLFEFTVAYTGEEIASDRANWFSPILAETGFRWGDSYVEWKGGNNPNAIPLHWDVMQPSEWRLTEWGIDLKTDSRKGKNNLLKMLAYTLKLGPFKDRKLVPGDITLSRKQWKEDLSRLPLVNVNNLTEVAKVVSNEMLPKMQAMLLESLENIASKNAPLKPACGPFGIDGFRWAGKEYIKMPPT